MYVPMAPAGRGTFECKRHFSDSYIAFKSSLDFKTALLHITVQGCSDMNTSLHRGKDDSDVMLYWALCWGCTHIPHVPVAVTKPTLTYLDQIVKYFSKTRR